MALKDDILLLESLCHSLAVKYHQIKDKPEGPEWRNFRRSERACEDMAVKVKALKRIRFLFFNEG